MTASTTKKQLTMFANLAELHFYNAENPASSVDLDQVSNIQTINVGRGFGIKTGLVKNPSTGLFEGRSHIYKPDLKNHLPIKLPLIQFNAVTGDITLKMKLGKSSVTEKFKNKSVRSRHSSAFFALDYLKVLAARISYATNKKLIGYDRSVPWSWLEDVLQNPSLIRHRGPTSEETYEIVTDTTYPELAQLGETGTVLRVKIKTFNGDVKIKVLHWVVKAVGEIDVYDEHNTTFSAPDRKILIQL